MILIFEPTPFARSKSLANGVGLFYKDKLIYSHISTSRLYASAPSTYSVLISSNESLGDMITPSLPNLLK